MDLKRNAWKLALVGGALLIVEYFSYPSVTNQNIVYSVLGKAAVLCVLLGVRLHRPSDRLGWYFIAAAIACFSLGDDVTTYYQVIVHHVPFPSFADLSYLSGYPFLFAGVIRLTRTSGRSKWREDNADAAVVALGALAISYQFLMSPYVHDLTLSTFGMLVNLTYPIMDIALLFVVFRALMLRRTGLAFQKTLAVALSMTLIGDFTYDLLTLHNSYSTGNFVDAFFLLEYVFIAVSALLPSVSAPRAELADDAEQRSEYERLRRMPVVLLGGFVPPAILVVAAAAHATVDVGALATLCVAVFAVICFRLIWLVRGITAQSNQLEANLTQIEAVEERFRLAFEDNMAPMVFTDLDDRAIAANDAFCEMLGYDREEILGHDSAAFTYPDDVGISEEAFSRVSRGLENQSRYVKRYVRKDGRVITVEVLRSVAVDARGNSLYNVISERDITDERTLAAQLAHEAFHDTLTGLANRALFLDRLEQAQSRVTREGGAFAVLLLDLDDFKGVNDSLGHIAGDQLLISVARRLERVTRASDTLSRFGGDEFLYLADGLSSTADAEHTARRLLDALVEPFAVTGSRIEQRATIGVVVADGTRSNQNEFIRDADVALYEAKKDGKGNFKVFTPAMHQEVARQFTLVQELRHALQTEEISMHYQPIVELSSTRIVGCEALMRWQHPERGSVPPSVFIPFAEQSDLIVELGYFALRHAIVAASQWESHGGDPTPFVTVNLSARQYHDPNLAVVIEDLLAEHHVARGRLIVEITESAALQNVTETMSMMAQLRQLGVDFALDDFGIGYSSLSYLQLLHPMIIKIDRSFVSPTFAEPKNEDLLEAIIGLGHHLNMTMLAEGIETDEQFERLRELNCELGQGFLWSHAVPGDQVPALIDGGVHGHSART